MQQVTIGDMLDASVIEAPEDHCIYVVRDTETVFYVGQSIDPYERFAEHMGRSRRGSLDNLGRFILANMPESRQWIFETYTLADCEAITLQCMKNLDLPYSLERYYHPRNIQASVNDAEKAMIYTHNPCLNVTYNLTPTKIPAHYKLA